MEIGKKYQAILAVSNLLVFTKKPEASSENGGRGFSGEVVGL